MKLSYYIKGSVMPTVLVVSTLMLLAVAALFFLMDSESLVFGKKHYRRQLQGYVDSAFLLYERDSSIMERMSDEGILQLFGDSPASEVKISVSQWGMFEMVKVWAGNGEIKSARLMGNAYESPLKAALYICDNRRVFSLTGESDVKGTLYVPNGNLNYGQVQSVFYKGERVPEGYVKKSVPEFPSINTATADSLKNLLSSTVSEEVSDEVEVSFFSAVKHAAFDRLTDITLRGNVIVTDSTAVVVDSTAVLEDIIISAPKIIIRSGFRGTLQAIATDTIIVEPRAELLYPSGVTITGNGSYIEIGEGSEVSGYAIIRSKKQADNNSNQVNYRQSPGSVVRGLVFVDGVAQVEGRITGSFYANQSNYYTRSGRYSNVLNNATVHKTTELAYPLWMKSDYLKKTAKWLY